MPCILKDLVRRTIVWQKDNGYDAERTCFTGTVNIIHDLAYLMHNINLDLDRRLLTGQSVRPSFHKEDSKQIMALSRNMWAVQRHLTHTLQIVTYRVKT